MNYARQAFVGQVRTRRGGAGWSGAVGADLVLDFVVASSIGRTKGVSKRHDESKLRAAAKEDVEDVEDAESEGVEGVEGIKDIEGVGHGYLFQESRMTLAKAFWTLVARLLGDRSEAF